ncbi:hypothetical protein ACIG0C_36810 [Kitasatospora aureofaciens]|uniref:hypothetical protein n=1 Tax=Kitasatospora aureofaciens TaxID=1894 RepID=UPI000A862DCF|nr:hypothetical protein [Kitasatospora aureofaciens]UKZ03154.1 hypothetical protein BOQ63_003330 [Streptomyces viridifaciens]
MTRAAAARRAHSDGPGQHNPGNITMASGGTTKTTTSSLSGGGSFSVTWKHS